MKKIIKIMLALTIAVMMVFASGCDQADTMRHNIQQTNSMSIERLHL